MEISRHPTSALLLALIALTAAVGCGSASGNAAASTTTTTSTGGTTVANVQDNVDPTGDVATYSTTGSISEAGPFFTALGSNARTCATCHQLTQGFSISAASVQSLFSSTSGADPLFDAVDGANCPTAATGDTTAHSLILDKALVRIAITVPTTAQFTLTTVSDPYGCAVTTNSAAAQVVSVYRRPLPSSNLNFLSSVMWDGRETIDPLTSASTFSANLASDLTAQALSAVSTHEQGVTAPSATVVAALVAFEQQLYTAQASDSAAGSLSSGGATGGPTDLAAVTYSPGINDSLAGTPPGSTFNPNVFTLFTAWVGSTNAQQASIARGENIFNTAPLTIENVPGINDGTAPKTLRASCSFCHDTPNVGNHSLPLPMDTGTAHILSAETDPNIVAALATLDPAILPAYQITGCTSTITGQITTYTTSDPATGLFTGQCADVNRTKVPTLRGLAARAPYFHGGAADSLAQVVAFYNARFQMNLSSAQQADLVNFLNAL